MSHSFPWLLFELKVLWLVIDNYHAHFARHSTTTQLQQKINKTRKTTHPGKAVKFPLFFGKILEPSNCSKCEGEIWKILPMQLNVLTYYCFRSLFVTSMLLLFVYLFNLKCFLWRNYCRHFVVFRNRSFAIFSHFVFGWYVSISFSIIFTLLIIKCRRYLRHKHICATFVHLSFLPRVNQKSHPCAMVYVGLFYSYD